jgi:hypothetical protein
MIKLTLHTKGVVWIQLHTKGSADGHNCEVTVMSLRLPQEQQICWQLNISLLLAD